MAKAVLGMSKPALTRVLTGSAAFFGITGVLAPQALAAAYAVPSTPHTLQLFRLFGSRMLAIAGWAATARTEEETDRVLVAAAGVNLLDVLTALAAARGTGSSTAVRAAATSGGYAALALFVRSLDD